MTRRESSTNDGVMENPVFTLEMQVRDYECDLQGIVNNAVYQNYLEHARHQYIRSLGLDFAQMHQESLDPVVFRIEMDFIKPLTSTDVFIVQLKVEKEGRLKFIFAQDIVKKLTGDPVLKAKVFTVFTQKGRPVPPPAPIAAVLEPVVPRGEKP